jgi:calcineurin-like phosphoesterase family protein
MIFHKKFSGDHIHFISDLHFNHKNICRGVSNWSSKDGTRDFETLEEMNDAIIKSINLAVPENDDLIIGGDFMFGNKDLFQYFRSTINCKNVHLVYGNHDLWLRKKPELHHYFSSIQDYLELFCKDRTGKYRLVSVFHYPVKSWNDVNSGAIAITGHEHGHMPYLDHECALDVGWENYKKPLSFFDVCDLMDKKVPLKLHHRNFVVRVVLRKRVLNGDKECPGTILITRRVMNCVVSAKNSKEARKMIRKEYGHLAIIGFIRRTNMEPCIYIPTEKRLFGA